MDKQGLLTDGCMVSLVSTEVFCEITHLTSNVQTTFTYLNQFNKTLHAEFVFPLEEVSVYSFEAHVADRVILAECRPRDEAKNTFDEAVKGGHTAFLAEQDEESEDMFQISIGNVQPKETIKIILKYVGHLRMENVNDGESIKSQVTFSLPSVINPRYTPEESKIERDYEVFGLASAATPKSYDLKFEASVFLPHPIASVSSSKDNFSMTRDSEDPRRAKVKLTSAFKSDHNLYMTMEMKEPLHSSAVCVLGDPSKSSILSMGCLMAHFIPDLADVVLEQESRTELVFVIDRSGSMSGSNIRNASESLLLFLKALPLGCRFQIIGFGSTHSSLFDAPTDYNEQSLQRALEYQQLLDADMGGTDVLPALETAYKAPLSGEGWYRQIIFITDGDVTNCSEVLGLIGSNVNKARLFTVGIGRESATHLIASTARIGRGMHAFINKSAQLSSVVMKILGAALQPRANEIQIKWEVQDNTGSKKASLIDVIQVPQTLAPVFHGNFLTVYGLLPPAIKSQPKGSIGLTCEILGKKQTFRVDLENMSMMQSTEDAPLHRLAGKCQMNELTDAHKIALMSDRSKDEVELTQIRQRVEKISCAINILSPITAMIGVDPVKREPILEVDSDRVIESNERTSIGSRFRSLFKRRPTYVYPRPAMSGRTSSAYMSMQESRQIRSVLGSDSQRSRNSNYAVQRSRHSNYAGQCSPISKYAERANLMMDSNDDELSKEQPMYRTQPMRFKSSSVNQTKIEVKGWLKLAELQGITGSWVWSKDVAEQMNLHENMSRNSKPSTWPTPSTHRLDDLVWSTAIVVVFFETRLIAHKEEWTLLITKARVWLVQQAANAYSGDPKASKLLVDDLLKLAKHAIDKK